MVAIMAVFAASCAPPSGPDRPDPTVPVNPADPPGTVRYFGSDASWNRPAAELGRSTQYASYADRFWVASDLRGVTDPSARGQVDLLFGDYSVPIYDRRDATTTRRVFHAGWGWPGNLGPADAIPWNPEWKPAPGQDAIMLILDPDTGTNIELWAVQGPNWTSCVTLENLLAGFVGGKDLCVGAASVSTNADGTPTDVRSEFGATSMRGMGIEKLALVTRAEEVASGRIDHALAMSVGNTMFGPECDATAPGAGTDCGFFVAPATKVEHLDGPAKVCDTYDGAAPDARRSLTVPSGMRFALNMTDAQIDEWLASRNLAEPLRTTTRIFAVALRDYGWVIAETTCSGSVIETDGITNPETAAMWAELGVTRPEVGHGLLDGLFTRDRIVVINPTT